MTCWYEIPIASAPVCAVAASSALKLISMKLVSILEVIVRLASNSDGPISAGGSRVGASALARSATVADRNIAT